MSGLVLSIFPSGGLLDHAFELEGFCVVRGPDLIWGGDILGFHPPTGVFDGVIGGPPCQRFSPIGNVNRARWGDDSVMPDLIPEFARVVIEASPKWWLMENSPHAYAPNLEGSRQYDLNNAWLGEEQARHRRFWTNLSLNLEVPTFGNQQPVPTVCSTGSVDWKGSRSRGPSRDLPEMMRLQGMPLDWFEHSPFTVQAKRKIVGNGVAIPMGRQLARAIRKANEIRVHRRKGGGE